eukprot:3840222-Rhodomonas_salina.3
MPLRSLGLPRRRPRLLPGARPGSWTRPESRCAGRCWPFETRRGTVPSSVQRTRTGDVQRNIRRQR